MLINNVKKEISIALEGLLLAKMLMRISDAHNKDQCQLCFSPQASPQRQLSKTPAMLLLP